MHPSDAPSTPRRVAWAAVTAIIATVLFVLATSDVVYEITSPPQFSWHVVLRKAYSIVAFALVGFTADKALGMTARPLLRGAVLIAVYSGAIEIAQKFSGSHEGPVWNAIDVACGAAGGWLGVAASRFRKPR
ncbi:hypothetical protein WPS_20870 [Vulcanimicrobium alpinum]|uniref:Uncharacterized protein n=1 Tax=Vulcanimicrobium alpinum TaxID=3016050 RepID=A0AAN1XWS1_UNVUL|nr:hypothetical protein [Vulcanimicrobium alpinum]BDE06811.1 hypothetical protein WPS_20870 [Vulcanimicrobium alpinum]